MQTHNMPSVYTAYTVSVSPSIMFKWQSGLVRRPLREIKGRNNNSGGCIFMERACRVTVQKRTSGFIYQQIKVMLKHNLASDQCTLKAKV
jgi:hypothetical protein